MIYEQQEVNRDRRSELHFHHFDTSLHVAAFVRKSPSSGFYLNYISFFYFLMMAFQKSRKMQEIIKFIQIGSC
jgi:hypothetical protein